MYYVSLRAEEKTGGRGLAPLHVSERCASRFYGDVGEIKYEPTARTNWCGRCAKHKRLK